MAYDITNVMAIGAGIGQWIYRIGLMLFLGGGLYLIAFYWNKRRRFSWTVRIFNKDATGNIVQEPDDKGGIFLDKKTQYRLFMLKRSKFGLDPDEIPYILTTKGTKVVYLLQTGLKNFQFMKPQVSGNPGIVFNVQDEDVAWAINAWERYKNPYKNQFIEKIMPFIGMAFVFLTVVVALYYIIMKSGFNAELLRELAASSKAIAESLAKASLGTVVVD